MNELQKSLNERFSDFPTDLRPRVLSQEEIASLNLKYVPNKEHQEEVRYISFPKRNG